LVGDQVKIMPSSNRHRAHVVCADCRKQQHWSETRTKITSNIGRGPSKNNAQQFDGSAQQLARFNTSIFQLEFSTLTFQISISTLIFVLVGAPVCCRRSTIFSCREQSTLFHFYHSAQQRDRLSTISEQ
jgi:hypothetical protein